MKRLLPMVALLASLATWGDDVRELRWAELIPEGAPAAAPPVPLHGMGNLADALAAEATPTARQPDVNAPVVQALDGVEARLPGYIVPLEVSEEGRVTEFLLVPYFGACIHVPPPPSNQIVHVTTELGVPLALLYEPYWVEGPLRVRRGSSELADTGYAMEADKIYPYE
jgi:hypothetical protein